MTQILIATPIWVWPLFIALLSIGLRARRARDLPIWVMYLLPLMAVLSVRTVAGMGAGPWIWAVFAGAFLAGATLGWQRQRAWLLGRAGPKLHVAGENMTLFVIMVIFWARFVQGFVEAVAPDVAAGAPFQIVFVAVISAAGATFSGRALRTLVYVRGRVS